MIAAAVSSFLSEVIANLARTSASDELELLLEFECRARFRSSEQFNADNVRRSERWMEGWMDGWMDGCATR